MNVQDQAFKTKDDRQMDNYESILHQSRLTASVNFDQVKKKQSTFLDRSSFLNVMSSVDSKL